MRKKIPVAQVRRGMHIDEFCGAWTQHPFWSARFTVEKDEDVARVRDCGLEHVWIDTQRGLDVEQSSPGPAAVAQQAAAKPRPRGTQATSLPDEARRAAQICERSREAVVSMFSELRMGRAVSSKLVGEVVEEISSSVLRNPAALISLARLKTVDDYTYMHSVAVCALMVSLARQLDLDEAQAREAGTAGLLHDLGKALMPLEILNKPTRLTEQEFAIMRTHPVEGHRVLLEAGTVGAGALDVCLHHHERVDGTGYPERLSGDGISLIARMGAVCDVYDAITSNRPYKAGWNPAESIRRMAEWSGAHLDQRVFHAFVRSVGIYPVGSLVRMASGRIGIVVEQGPQDLLTPRVKTFFSVTSQTYVVPEIVDLARPGCTDRIVGREDETGWDLDELSVHWTAPT